MSSAHGPSQPVDVLRKGLIVAVLVGGLVLLHRFAGTPHGADPRGLLALGFVVLAAYTIGELAEVLKLPHITGYLLAGFLLGPSVAHELTAALPPGALPAPFDHGILSEAVIGQLSLLDTLALPLIALTAGGELHLKELRTGLKPILGVLLGQTAFVLPAFVLFAVLLGGVVPGIGLPALSGVGLGGQVAIGLVLGSLALATSAAATIAVILGAGAKGPMTRTILSVVVLKDVLVVVLFAASTTVAAAALGVGGGEGLGQALVHIGLSVVLGVVVGGLVHLYLRFVGAERLLFLVALIYTTAFLCGSFDLEVALVFIAAGFMVANFSNQGETLISDVERLSLPVFVVFFTLAGARLHVDVIVRMAGYAALLVGVRMAATAAGVAIGGRLGGADPATRKYGWLGLIAQAGLAISLAGKLPELLPGGIGEELFALVLAGVAVHEVVGPAMLQFGLGKAGEVPGPSTEPVAEIAADTATPPTTTPDPTLEEGWGPAFRSSAPALTSLVAELEEDLRGLTVQWGDGVPRAWSDEARQWLANLRTDYLRAHRRLAVLARDPDRDPDALVGLLREVEVAWRGRVLARAAADPLADWSPVPLVQRLDRRLDALPASVSAPIEPEVLAPRDETIVKRALRAVARERQRLVPGRREVPVAALARFHVSGRAVGMFEGLPALAAREELDLARQLGALFSEIAERWPGEGGDPSPEALAALRADVDEAFGAFDAALAAAPVEAGRRCQRVVGRSMARFKEELPLFGTLDLPQWRRRFSGVFAERNRGLEAVTQGLAQTRVALEARFQALAMELEVAGLSVTAAAVAHGRVAALERQIEDLAHKPLQRLDQAAGAALHEVEALLESEGSGAELAEGLRARSSEAGRVALEAERLLGRLVTGLERAGVDGVQDELSPAIDRLSDRVKVPAGALEAGDWALPRAPGVVELPLRETVGAFVEARVGADLVAVTRSAALQVTRGQTAVDELRRVLTFNVELAVAELEVFADAPASAPARALAAEMLQGSVGRSRQRLQRVADDLATLPETVGEGVTAAVVGRLTDLRRDLAAGDAGRLRRLVLTEVVVRRQLARQADRLTGPSGLVRVRSAALARQVLGRDALEQLARWWRPPALQAPTAAQLAAPTPIDPLPVVYRRLFTDQVVASFDLEPARDLDLAAAQAALEAPAGLRVVALVSDDAALRSLLVEAISRAAGLPVTRLGGAAVPNGAAAGLTLIDDLGDRFRLTPGGFGSLDALVAAMTADPHRRPWLVTATPETWAAASSGSSLGSAVGTVLRPAHLSVAELTRAMLGRHTMSGYDVAFSLDDLRGLRDLSLLGREGDRAARQRAAWFAHLHERAEGRLADALLLWMAAIRAVDDAAGRVELGPVQRLPSDALRALPVDALSLLRHALRQGHLDPADLAGVLGEPLVAIRGRLSALAAWGLLAPRGDRWVLPEHLVGPLRTALAREGWT